MYFWLLGGEKQEREIHLHSQVINKVAAAMWKVLWKTLLTNQNYNQQSHAISVNQFVYFISVLHDHNVCKLSMGLEKVKFD